MFVGLTLGQTTIIPSCLCLYEKYVCLAIISIRIYTDIIFLLAYSHNYSDI